MKLAFYYHVPLHVVNGQLLAPSYLAVFLEELASNVSELVVVFHAANDKEQNEADAQLNAKNLRLVNLGKKKAAWHRSLFPGSTLKNKLKEVENCDAFLIRSPSPLAAAFTKFVTKPKCFFMIVGDYGEGAKQIDSKGLKNKLLKVYFNHIDKQFKDQFPNTDMFVNSPLLVEKYQKTAKSIQLIKTSTLTASDFNQKEHSILQSPVQLLYTGRIEVVKGLVELVDATHQLLQKGRAVHLNIVGWENSPQKPFEQQLLEQAKLLGIENHITFHGKKQVGTELNGYYREADIYILPSYHEGFPRTIWEAMANSLPVIATNVGGIPHYLSHLEQAILIQPKKSSEITLAVEKLIEDTSLRKNLIRNGFEMVKENTVEHQTKLLIDSIKTLTL